MGVKSSDLRAFSDERAPAISAAYCSFGITRDFDSFAIRSAVVILELLKQMRVFVSVGTTRFDNLISIFGDMEILRALSNAGVTRLTIQHGNSPLKIPSLEADLKLEVNSFAYAPSLASYLEDTDMVFSHAATGIYLEAMQLQLPHFLIVNTSLHENHQAEFADLLADSSRCRAFADADTFRMYLLSGVLTDDFPLMKSSTAIDQPQTPPAFLKAISQKSQHTGILGIILVAILLLVLAQTA